MKKLFIGSIICLTALFFKGNYSHAASVEPSTVLSGSSVTEFVSNEEDTVLEFLVPENEMNQDLQRQVQEFINSKTGVTRSPTYVNLTQKVVDTKYPVASGYAGNQPARGTKFPSGGGFYWSAGGGPNVSVSAGYAGISISTNLGKSGTSGNFVTAPNKTQYFKLYVSEKYKVQKVAVYGAPYTNPNGPKQLLYYTYPKTLYSRSLSAKAQ